MTQPIDVLLDDDGSEDAPLRFAFTVNPAVMKGAATAGVGLFVLLAPEPAATLLQPILAIGLLAIGGADIWAIIRRKEGRRIGGLLAILSFVAGAALLLLPNETLERIFELLGLYLIVRGLLAALRLVFRRSSSKVLDVSAAGVQLSLGLLLVSVPDAVSSALLGAFATAAVALGGIMLAYGLRADNQDADINLQTVRKIGKEWIVGRDIGEVRRAQIANDLYFEQPGRIRKLAAWWVMLLLSVAIATYGILQDSTAVVIGAMLIAPLMTPIVAAAASIVNGRRARLARSMALVGAGVAGAITLAFIIGRWTPVLIPLLSNSQVTSRTSPNVIDMAIALAAGAAGAFAIINPRVASSLAGVAIAVALVPPLGVVGLTLNDGEFSSALGAFVLFLTNLVSILLSATLVFGLSGWTNVSRLKSNASSIALTVGVIVAAAMVILLPLMFTAQGILIKSSRQTTATTATTEWAAEYSPKLAVQSVALNGAEVIAEFSGPQSLGDPAPLAAQLSEDFGEEVTLQLTLIPTSVVQYSKSDGTTNNLPTARPSPGTDQAETPPPNPSLSRPPTPNGGPG
jgi:uncharacterized hydrophobic protein (TIGR00271 family)